ncbi:MAG: hypothetical protein AB7S36_04930 [Planctomycetota bacterium]
MSRMRARARARARARGEGGKCKVMCTVVAAATPPGPRACR